MNDSIFLHPGSNDRLPIPWRHAFQFSVILQCCDSKIVELYVYRSILCIIHRHDIPLIRQQYVNTNATDTPKVISLYNGMYTFAVISSYVAKFAASLHCYTRQMTAVEPSRKLPFWPERDAKGHDLVSCPTWRRLSANLRIDFPWISYRISENDCFNRIQTEINFLA